MIDRRRRPWIGKVGTEHNLTYAGHRNQMAKSFASENQRIKVDLLEIFRGLLFQRLIALFGERDAAMVGPVRVSRKVSTTMSGAQLELRETIPVSYTHLRAHET